MEFLKHEGEVILGGVEELSTIVSEVPFVGAIGSLVSVIVAKALQARANKEQCTRLALRAKIVWQALVPLVSSASTIDAAHASAFSAALEQLASTLTACRDLVQQFAETANWKRWLLAGKHHERFAELTAQLSEDQQALSLGLDVDAFAYREADKASAKSDMQQLEQLLLQMQREQQHNTERVVRAVRLSTKRTVAAVERAIDDTSHAQTDEIKQFIAAQLQQLQQFAVSGKPPAVAARQDSLAAAGGPMPVPEISPCQVEIDDSCHVRVTSDDSGVVFEGKWMGERVSVKRLLPPEGARLSAEDQARFRREVQIGANLRHPRILCLYGGFVDESGALLVTECAELGSLDTHAMRNELPQTKRAQLCEDIALALAYVHSCLVWHRALRASACVVTADWRAKLADLARAKSHASEVATAAQLTHEWRWTAPEVLMSTTKRGHTAASDMYSFGMLLFEVFVGAEPWAECVNDTQATLSVMKRLTDVASANRATPTPSLPDSVPLQVRDLMHMCWQRRPGSRPLAVDAAYALRELCSVDQRIVSLLDDAAKALSANPRQAAQLLERAASLGSAQAHTRLGDIFSGLKATTLPSDGARAVTHYEAAAAGGDKRAAFNVACIFREGKLVPKDTAKARAAFERAKELGNEHAAAELKLLN